MKFYTNVIVTFSDGAPDKVGMYTQPTADAAIKAFYYHMWQYVDADNVATVFAEAVNNVGGVYKHESWVKTVEQEVYSE